METFYIINVDGDNGSREKYCMVLKHSEKVTLKQNLKKRKKSGRIERRNSKSEFILCKELKETLCFWRQIKERREGWK